MTVIGHRPKVDLFETDIGLLSRSSATPNAKNSIFDRVRPFSSRIRRCALFFASGGRSTVGNRLESNFSGNKNTKLVCVLTALESRSTLDITANHSHERPDCVSPLTRRDSVCCHGSCVCLPVVVVERRSGSSPARLSRHHHHRARVLGAGAAKAGSGGTAGGVLDHDLSITHILVWHQQTHSQRNTMIGNECKECTMIGSDWLSRTPGLRRLPGPYCTTSVLKSPGAAGAAAPITSRIRCSDTGAQTQLLPCNRP